MYTGLQHAHSYIAYIALFVLAIAAINAIVGLVSKREFTAKDRKISLFGLIFTHTQLLIGLIVYFVSPKVQSLSTAMKNSDMRLFALEHPFINIIAVILITIGFSKHKKAITSQQKFKSIAIMYSIGLFLILSRIPWKAWF